MKQEMSRSRSDRPFLLKIIAGCILSAAFASVLLTAGRASAEGGESPLLGPPVHRDERSFELRPDTRKGTSPIAYSFRIAVDDSKAEPAKAGSEQDPDALPLPPATKQELSPAQKYCSSILDATSAAQVAEQTRKLQKAQKEIDDRVTLLAAKAAVLKSWMKLRQDFVARATESLVEIYSRMEPDAAAPQLAEMDEMTSAAIISKLPPKIASPIMAEMDAKKAARLSSVIAGAGELAMQTERKANGQH